MLLDAELHLDAAYLAGYGIECALKAAIIAATTPSKRLSLVAPEFRGARDHPLGYWIVRLRQERGLPPLEVIDAVREARSWSTGLRYEVAGGDAAYTRTSLNAAVTVHDWCERSFP